MTERFPLEPRSITKKWLERLLLSADVKYLPVSKTTAQKLAPWAGLMTLVGSPDDDEALDAFQQIRELLLAEGRHRRWIEAAAEVPANREAVLNLATSIAAYEKAALAGGLTPLRRAGKLDRLPMVIRGMIRVSRAPDAYMETAAHAWCDHPHAVFSDEVMEDLAKQLPGLLGWLSRLYEGRQYEDEKLEIV